MNARQFRKRPVVVEAMQYNAANCEAIHKWLGLQHHVYPGEPCGVGMVPVTTIHGTATFVRPGEYIVAEPEPGRFYPVRADIFADTYEPVDSDAALPPQSPDLARMEQFEKASDSKVSYAATCKAVAENLEHNGKRAAEWIKGDYEGAPDWPAMSRQWLTQAAALRALAALVEEAERIAAANMPFSIPSLALIRQFAAGFPLPDNA